MSVPTGQPHFSSALPRPPALSGQAPYGAASLVPPTQGGAFPRPLPVPTVLPARPQAGPLPGGPVVLNPPRDGRAPPSIMPPKQTTLYVGKIAPSISDSLIKQLLDACGPVKSWKRMEDPDTKALKAFGFCEFEEADGVLRALSLLQNLSIGGQELLLKCNTGTQKYIDEMESRKISAIGNPQAGEDGQTAQETDNEALEKIMGLVSSHAEQLPPPPEAVAAADSFLSSLKSEAEKKDKPSRERLRGRRDIRENEDGKALEASLQRERDLERREHEARMHEQDQAYKAALRKWEDKELDIRKTLERDIDHERDIARERRRQLKADLEADDDNEEPWQRKLYAGSRRAADRKRWREKEWLEDRNDRLREEEEQEAKRAKQSETEAVNGHRESSLSQSPVMHIAAQARLQDPNDSITQAMMTAAKAPRSTLSAEQSQDTAAAVQPKPKKPVALAVFGGDEDDDQPKRTFKPLTYTEEEQKAAQQAAPATLKDKQAVVKELIAKVPTEIKAVFRFQVDWKAYDDGGNPLKERIRNWVKKRTAALLKPAVGDDDDPLVNYVMELLAEHKSAEEATQALQEILDEEARPLVFKLFRMVIFETLKQAANLQE